MIETMLAAGLIGVTLLVIWAIVKTKSVEDSHYWDTFDPADHT